MNWPWSTPDFSKGAVLTANADLTAILAALSPSAYVDDEYANFLRLDESQLVALVNRAWDAAQITYGSDSPDFPLCYDFAELAEAAVRLYAIKAGLKERPAFGTLRYTLTNETRHAICFAVLASGKVKYFEPQPVEFPWMDTPQDLKSLDEFFI